MERNKTGIFEILIKKERISAILASLEPTPPPQKAEEKPSKTPEDRTSVYGFCHRTESDFFLIPLMPIERGSD